MDLLDKDMPEPPYDAPDESESEAQAAFQGLL